MLSCEFQSEERKDNLNMDPATIDVSSDQNLC